MFGFGGGECILDPGTHVALPGSGNRSFLHFLRDATMVNAFYEDLARRFPQIGTSSRQYQGVSHVVAEGEKSRCLICRTGPMVPNNSKIHFRSRRHQKRHALVRQCQQKQRSTSEILAHNLDGAVLRNIHHSPWRSMVKCSMYDFLMKFQTLEKCHLLFAKILRMESMTLLELALSKLNIVDNLIFSTMQEMREYPILESTFDIPTYIYDMRVNSGAQVVIPLVLEFLGPIRYLDIPRTIRGQLFKLS